MNTLIQCNNLCKTYEIGKKSVHALKNATLSINRGEYVAILGPSGSGKSTLMSLLGCLDQPTSGEYLLDGKNVAKFNDDQLADVRNQKIGFIFQSFHLLPHVSALDNVALPLLFRGISMKQRRQMASDLLEKLGLASHADQTPNQLSGGQQQRIAIARALITNPEVILADEPTGNLDSKSSEIVMKMFSDFLSQDPSKTLIMITHNDALAKRTQRIITVKDGEISNS